MDDEDDDLPPSEAPQRRPMTFLSAAMWTLLVVLLFGVAVGFSESARAGAMSDPVTLAGGRLLATSLAVFGIARLHEPELSIGELVAFRRPSILMTLLAVVVGLASAPAASWVESAITQRLPPSSAELESMARLTATDTLGKRVALVVAFALVFPICEELFVRGAVFSCLKRGRAAQVVVAATALFDVLGALDPRALFPMLAFGVLMGWVRAQSGSVVPSLLARVAFFSYMVLPLALRGQDLTPPGSVAIASLAGASLAFLALLKLGTRDARSLEARTQDG